jgi:hypothetical protein
MNRLEVASLLALKMNQAGSTTVAQATGQPVERLLRMIEGTAPFNRAVLRYLSLRRVEDYRPLQNGSPDGCATS